MRGSDVGTTRPTTAVDLDLPFAPGSAAVARRRLTAWLDSLEQPEPVVDDSRLVLSELIGNSVRHARPLPDGTMHVTWHRVEVATGLQSGPESVPESGPESGPASGPASGRDRHRPGWGVAISVSDGGGDTRPHEVHGNDTDPFGRGLSIIGRVADRWWYETDGADRVTCATTHAVVALD